MAVAPLEQPTHPMVRALDDTSQMVSNVQEHNPVCLSTVEKEHALLVIADLEARLASIKLGLLAVSGDVAEAHAFKNPGGWLAHATRHERATGRRDHDLALALDSTWTQIAAALAAGDMNLPQARAAVAVLEELPDDLEVGLREAVEAQLVVLAQTWPPTELKTLGRRLLEAIAPDIAEAHEAAQLEREERDAQQTMSITRRRKPNGADRFILDLPHHGGDRFLTYLDALANPRRTSEDVRGPLQRRRAQAFLALLEQLDPTQLPRHGGTATTVVITLSLEALRKRLAAGDVLGHDLDRMSAGQIRRLACTAGIIPAVLGTESEILDLGRQARLFSTAQNRARKLRDKTCRAVGCDIPAAWTEGHHKHPWSEGGRTDLELAVSLCSWHHHLAHDDRYITTYLPNGDVTFHRRT